MFSNIPRVNMEEPDQAVKKILEYLIKQKDELEYKFLHLDSDNVQEIDCNLTHMKNLPEVNVEQNVITEVIHNQVINVETAHILNAWIKNLFVEYVETNMDARLDRTTVDRYFIRIEDVNEEMVEQKLDPTQIEDLLIPDPRGNGNLINVYFTAIGDHKDAYRYFTITNPRDIHKDLTSSEVEAFKVKVKKRIAERVRYRKGFAKIRMNDGTETVTPMELWGAGTDTTGLTDKGKTRIFKDQVGYTIQQIYETSTDFLGFRLNGATKEFETHRNAQEGWRKASFGGGDFKSLDFYTDGFIVNKEAKFKWVTGGLQTEDGTIIPIIEHTGGIPV